MPIYEYQCDACQKTFEVSQKFTDDPLTECQSCSGPVRKIISAPGIVFKGSGWYVTDYPTSDRKKSMEADKKKEKPASCPSAAECSKSTPSCSGAAE